MTTTDLMIPTGQEIQARLALAGDLVKSGFLPKHIDTPQKALAILQMGVELGLKPMQALSNVYVVHGKPALDGKTMLGLLQRHGVMVEILEATDKACRGRAKRYYGSDPAKANADLWVVVKEEVTIKDAQALGLLNREQWKKQPRVMLRWKVVGALARLIAADLIGGMEYVREELEGLNSFGDAEQPVQLREVEAPQVESVTRGQDDTRIGTPDPAPAPQDAEWAEPENADETPQEAPRDDDGGDNGRGDDLRKRAASNAEKASGGQFISEGKRKRIWAIAYGRAKELGYDDVKGEAAGMVRTVLDNYGIEPDPNKPNDGPSTNCVPWRGNVYDDICGALENWGNTGEDEEPF